MAQAGQLAFQQIMAEHAAGDDAVFGGVQKGRRINDALAHKGAAPVKILREVGREGVVGVRAAASPQQQGKAAAYRMRGDFHARLQYADAAHTPLHLLPPLQGISMPPTSLSALPGGRMVSLSKVMT